jgi:hypothetical protein
MEILISCMDRRLNAYLDSLNKGNIILLRNAGANVSGLSYTLSELLRDENIKSIKVVAHTDCGAMKTVSKALKGELKLSKESTNTLVSKFADSGTKDPSELEKINVQVQKSELEKISKERGIKSSVDLLDISKIDVPKGEGEHKMALMNPSSLKYGQILNKEEMFNTYVIQSKSLEEKMVDIEIATKVLGIKKAEVLALGASEYRGVEADIKKLKLNPLLNGIEINARRF